MHLASPPPSHNSHVVAEVPSRLKGWLIAVVLATGAVACGPTDAADEPPTLARQTQRIEGFNGLSLNGLSANGLSLNGLSLNGLSLNGLSVNGLSAPIFSSWFEQAPSHSDMVMRYVVLCALPQGQSLTYTQPQTQVTHTWYGRLGLAPVWASGQPPPLVEQHLISACLAAHANKYGVSVPISVLGEDSAGSPSRSRRTSSTSTPARMAASSATSSRTRASSSARMEGASTITRAPRVRAPSPARNPPWEHVLSHGLHGQVQGALREGPGGEVL